MMYIIVGHWYVWTLRPKYDLMLYGVWTSGYFGKELPDAR